MWMYKKSSAANSRSSRPDVPDVFNPKMSFRRATNFTTIRSADKLGFPNKREDSFFSRPRTDKRAFDVLVWPWKFCLAKIVWCHGPDDRRYLGVIDDTLWQYYVHWNQPIKSCWGRRWCIEVTAAANTPAECGTEPSASRGSSSPSTTRSRGESVRWKRKPHSKRGLMSKNLNRRKEGQDQRWQDR